nr:TIR domain-containing protein [Vibrio sp. D420a]
MKIFVSYTVRDSIVTEALLQRVFESVAAFGSPYIDLIHNDSADKQARVERELRGSHVLLLLETSSTIKSPWVQWELDTAQSLGIPIKSIQFNDPDFAIRHIQSVFEG